MSPLSPSPPPEREAALFALALERPAPKRAAFLDAMCEGDAALRQPLHAGTTEVRRPCSVMELVRGIKITDYSNQATLTTRGQTLFAPPSGDGGPGEQPAFRDGPEGSLERQDTQWTIPASDGPRIDPEPGLDDALLDQTLQRSPELGTPALRSRHLDPHRAICPCRAARTGRTNEPEAEDAV